VIRRSTRRVQPVRLDIFVRPTDTTWSLDVVCSTAPTMPLVTSLTVRGVSVPALAHVVSAVIGNVLRVSLDGPLPLGVYEWAVSWGGRTRIAGVFVSTLDPSAGSTPSTISLAIP
jgi:hypothetical protein